MRQSSTSSSSRASFFVLFLFVRLFKDMVRLPGGSELRVCFHHRLWADRSSEDRNGSARNRTRGMYHSR